MKQVASFAIVVFALAVLPSAPVRAQDPGAVPTAPSLALPGEKGDRQDRVSATAEERNDARLDRMFEQLSEAGSKPRADRIARHILRRMTRSGSDTVDLLMTRAEIAIRSERYSLALDLLDGVVRLEPDFAEGWNRRATVHYLTGDYGRSIADIEQTLRREPRHWGALVGLSVMLASMDRKEQAVEVMDRALTIHPYLEDMRKRRDNLAAELDGSAT